MTSSPMSWPEWVSHDAVSLAGLVRAGQLQAREVVGQAAQALARVDGDLSAALETFDDVLEDPAADGPDPEGRLYGEPMFLKDLGSRLAGRRQELGSALGARRGDHRVVARARQARGDAHPLRGGVAASAVNDTMDVFTDPHLNARGCIQRVPHPDHGEVTPMGSPIRMSDSSVELRARPLLGQHTDDVLAEELAIGAETPGALREAGAIGAPVDAAAAARAE